jgi:four helix bundle protein
MTETGKAGKYDLEERTFQFAKQVALCCKKLPRTVSNVEYTHQAVKASGSVGANYREANEALSKKDFRMRVKISRKESKESAYWLRLLVETNDPQYAKEGSALGAEATELKKIFSSIVEKSH